MAIAANFVFGALMCAGIGNYAAFPLVTTLGEHLTLMRWVVVVVIVYAAVSMLRSTAACVAARNTVEARKSADA